MATKVCVCIRLQCEESFDVRTELNMVPNGPVTYQQSKSSFDKTPYSSQISACTKLGFGHILASKRSVGAPRERRKSVTVLHHLNH